MSQPADPKLLEILVCPVSHVPLRYDAAHALDLKIRGALPA